MIKGLSVNKAAARKSALKKSSESAKKGGEGHARSKNHAAPGPKRGGEHDSQADTLRAYQHLARAGLLMEHLPQGRSLEELRRLSKCAQAAFEDDTVSPQIAAEAARALEHLLFAALSSARAAAQAAPQITKNQDQHFSDRLTHDLEQQAKHVHKAEEIFLKKSGSKLSDAQVFLILAKHSLLTAQKMLNEQEWQIVHECLRAADALAKAVDHSL